MRPIYERRLKERPWTGVLYAARKRAKQKGLPFDLTNEWCRRNWTGICALSGAKMTVGRGRGPKLDSPSLDRIDPRKGYTQENCRFITHALNCAKQQGTDDQLRQLAVTFLQFQNIHLTDYLDSHISL